VQGNPAGIFKNPGCASLPGYVLKFQTRLLSGGDALLGMRVFLKKNYLKELYMIIIINFIIYNVIMNHSSVF
jgi:hypothetical protein